MVATDAQYTSTKVIRFLEPRITSSSLYADRGEGSIEFWVELLFGEDRRGDVRRSSSGCLLYRGDTQTRKRELVTVEINGNSLYSLSIFISGYDWTVNSPPRFQ